MRFSTKFRLLLACLCALSVGMAAGNSATTKLELSDSVEPSSQVVAQPAARPEPPPRSSAVQELALASGDASEAAAESLLVSTDGRARELRFTVPGLQDNASGPLFPYFYDDLPPNEAEAFQRPTAQPTADLRSLLSAVSTPIPGCNYTRVPGCGISLTSCLLKDPVDRGVICTCYYDRGMCLRNIGCYDTMSRAELNYCFNELRCSMDDCEGLTAGVAAVRLTLSAAFFAAVAVAALL